jgi:transcriptional regulator NrdR family protein
MTKKIIKKNGDKEQFIKEKIVVSAVKAGAPVDLARDIAKQVERHPEDELKTKWIRQYVLNKLKYHNSKWHDNWINYDEGIKRLHKYKS